MNKSKLHYIRISFDIWQRVRKTAEELGTSQSNLVNKLLTDIMNNLDDDDRLWEWYRGTRGVETKDV